MAKFITKNIRNVALIGHSGSGKTATLEAMLYKAGATERLGKISQGNTVSDYDPEEIKRGSSVGLAIANLEWNGIKINILDCPGFLGFTGEVESALRVADSAIITVDAKDGVAVGTELAWYNAKKNNLPCSFFVNKSDDPEANFDKVFDQLREEFGNSLAPVMVPCKEADGSTTMIDLMTMTCFSYLPNGERQQEEMTPTRKVVAEKYQEIFMEAVAQTNEEMLEKFFEGETFTQEECALAIHEGMISGAITPVWCGSCERWHGIYSILTAIADSFPRHLAKKTEKSKTGGDIEISPEGECKLFVFKTVADPFVGRLSFFKVMNGELKKDMVLKNVTSGGTEKFSKIYTALGKKQTEVDALACGDIGVVQKISANTNDTLCETSETEYRPIKFSEPNMTMAIVTERGDEDKVSSAIQKILDEDKTVKYENFVETGELLIKGIGDVHLDTVVSKLKNRYGVTIKLQTPKIAYRETIKKTISVEGKHKKQSGGSGQYGHVKITFSPGEEEGLTFVSTVVGGEVPKNYFPAIEKGLTEAMEQGVLLGYPMVQLSANLTGGSYHDVDSNEISFKLAAKLAYKELVNAAPVLLEPIGVLKVSVPESMIGDVMGDLNKRRGRVTGWTPSPDRPKYTVVEAEVPKAEMVDYVITLRAMTQGRGEFTFHFVRYEEVPAQIAQRAPRREMDK